MLTRRIEAVVFDLDGTLLDSAPDLAAAVRRGLARDGLDDSVGLDAVRGWVGDGATALVRRAWASRGRELSGSALREVVQRFRDDYAHAPMVHTQPYPGIVATLDALAAAGTPVALCTNKPARHTRLVLEALGWTERFRRVVAGDTFPVKKPEAEPLLAAVDATGHAARDVVLVGDGAPDRGAATAVGTAFLWAGWGYGAPEVGQGVEGRTDPEALQGWLAERGAL